MITAWTESSRICAQTSLSTSWSLSSIASTAATTTTVLKICIVPITCHTPGYMELNWKLFFAPFNVHRPPPSWSSREVQKEIRAHPHDLAVAKSLKDKGGGKNIRSTPFFCSSGPSRWNFVQLSHREQKLKIFKQNKIFFLTLCFCLVKNPWLCQCT